MVSSHQLCFWYSWLILHNNCSWLNGKITEALSSVLLLAISCLANSKVNVIITDVNRTGNRLLFIVEKTCDSSQKKKENKEGQLSMYYYIDNKSIYERNWMLQSACSIFVSDSIQSYLLSKEKCDFRWNHTNRPGKTNWECNIHYIIIYKTQITRWFVRLL